MGIRLQQVPRGISLGPEHLAVFRIQILSFCFGLVSVAEPPVCSALALWQVVLVPCRLVRRRRGCDATAERCFVAALFYFLFFEVLAPPVAALLGSLGPSVLPPLVT